MVCEVRATLYSCHLTYACCAFDAQTALSAFLILILFCEYTPCGRGQCTCTPKRAWGGHKMKQCVLLDSDNLILLITNSVLSVRIDWWLFYVSNIG